MVATKPTTSRAASTTPKPAAHTLPAAITAAAKAAHCLPQPTQTHAANHISRNPAASLPCQPLQLPTESNSEDDRRTCSLNQSLEICSVSRMPGLEDMMTPVTDDPRPPGLKVSDDGGVVRVSMTEDGLGEIQLERAPVEKSNENGTQAMAEAFDVIRSQQRIVVGSMDSEDGGARGDGKIVGQIGANGQISGSGVNKVFGSASGMDMAKGIGQKVDGSPNGGGRIVGQLGYNRQISGQQKQIVGSKGQHRCWANVASDRHQRGKIKLTYHEPIVNSDGTITVCPPLSVALEGRRKWANCLVGSFIEKKPPFHSVQFLAVKMWQK